MKSLTLTLVAFAYTVSFFKLLQKRYNYHYGRIKAPSKGPILAEITSFILTQMPNKTMPTNLNNGDWDWEQTDESYGADIMINILDSVPYYAIYGCGNIMDGLIQDSLPKTFGKESFPIRNLNDKFNLLMLDWDKNYEAEQMALIPFRLSDYLLSKHNKIYLNSQALNDTSHTKITLNIIWH